MWSSLDAWLNVARARAPSIVVGGADVDRRRRRGALAEVGGEAADWAEAPVSGPPSASLLQARPPVPAAQRLCAVAWLALSHTLWRRPPGSHGPPLRGAARRAPAQTPRLARPAMPPPPRRALPEPTVQLLPNWAVAAVLAGFVGATYWYSARAVSVSDVAAELDREAERQQREQEG